MQEYVIFKEQFADCNKICINIAYMLNEINKVMKSDNWNMITMNCFRKYDINFIDMIFNNNFLSFADISSIDNIKNFINKKLPNEVTLKSDRTPEEVKLVFKYLFHLSNVFLILKFWKNDEYEDIIGKAHNTPYKAYKYITAYSNRFNVYEKDSEINKGLLIHTNDRTGLEYPKIKTILCPSYLQYYEDFKKRKPNVTRFNKAYVRNILFAKNKIFVDLLIEIKKAEIYFSRLAFRNNNCINTEFIDNFYKLIDRGGMVNMKDYIKENELTTIYRIASINMTGVYSIYLIAFLCNLREYIEITSCTHNKSFNRDNEIPLVRVCNCVISKIYKNKHIFGMSDVSIFDLVCNTSSWGVSMFGIWPRDLLLYAPIKKKIHTVTTIDTTVDEKKDFKISSFLTNPSSYLYIYNTHTGNCGLYGATYSSFNKIPRDKYAECLPLLSCIYLNSVNIKPPNVYYNRAICDLNFTSVYTQLRLFTFNLIFFGLLRYKAPYDPSNEHSNIDLMDNLRDKSKESDIIIELEHISKKYNKYFYALPILKTLFKYDEAATIASLAKIYNGYTKQDPMRKATNIMTTSASGIGQYLNKLINKYENKIKWIDTAADAYKKIKLDRANAERTYYVNKLNLIVECNDKDDAEAIDSCKAKIANIDNKINSINMITNNDIINKADKVIDIKNRLLLDTDRGFYNLKELLTLSGYYKKNRNPPEFNVASVNEIKKVTVKESPIPNMYTFKDLCNSTSSHCISLTNEGELFKDSNYIEYLDCNTNKCVFKEDSKYIDNFNLFNSKSSVLKGFVYDTSYYNPKGYCLALCRAGGRDLSINGRDIFKHNVVNGIKKHSLRYWWGFILDGREVRLVVNDPKTKYAIYKTIIPDDITYSSMLQNGLLNCSIVNLGFIIPHIQIEEQYRWYLKKDVKVIKENDGNEIYYTYGVDYYNPKTPADNSDKFILKSDYYYGVNSAVANVEFTNDNRDFFRDYISKYKYLNYTVDDKLEEYEFKDFLTYEWTDINVLFGFVKNIINDYNEKYNDIVRNSYADDIPSETSKIFRELTVFDYNKLMNDNQMYSINDNESDSDDEKYIDNTVMEENPDYKFDGGNNNKIKVIICITFLIIVVVVVVVVVVVICIERKNKGCCYNREYC